MTTKTTEQIRDELATKEAVEREKILRDSKVKPYAHEESYTASYFGRLGGFKSGFDTAVEHLKAENEDLKHDWDLMHTYLYVFVNSLRIASAINLLNVLKYKPKDKK